MKPREPMEDWEKDLHRELTGLPDLQAPPTLLPGVLNRIQAGAPAAWYSSPWWDWPVALRAASAVVVFGMLAMFAWAGTCTDLELGRQLSGTYAHLKATLGSALHSGVPGLGAGTEFWSRHGQWMLLSAGTLLFLTYLTCIAAGTALYQLAWRKSS